jgi:uncharacterized membrane protein YcfT
MSDVASAGPERVDWVDFAKGFCIIFVIMGHSTLGVQEDLQAHGWLAAVVEWARPFRIPAFFLISGLFLSRTIDSGWRAYLDRKVVHFAYFYVLWLTISFAFKGPFMAREAGWDGVTLFYLWSFVEPFGPLWFIYLLPVFYVATRLVRNVHPAVVILLGAAITPLHTGWSVADHFADCFVFFYTGYIGARHVFRLAGWARANPRPVLWALALWAVIHASIVFGGHGTSPLVALLLAFIGASAVVSGAALMARSGWFEFVRYCGQNSIVIYLAFFIPMAITRILLIKAGWIRDVGTLSLVVTVAAVIGPLVMYWLVRRTALRFLFVRPRYFHLQEVPRGAVLSARRA